MRHSPKQLPKPLILLAAIFISVVLLAQDNDSNTSPNTTPNATPETAPESPSEDTPETSGESGMTLERLDTLLHQLDEDLVQEGATWQFEFRDRVLVVVADGNADRMRIMSPVTASTGLDNEELYRLMQANFDSALDARYAVAQDTLWSVFVHPLSPLTDQQLASAIFQVYNTAATFGTIYSSGEFTYGGGDSNEQLQELQEELDRLLRPRT